MAGNGSRSDGCRSASPALQPRGEELVERQSGFVGWPKLRRPAEQQGYLLRENVERSARGVPSCDALRIGRKNRQPRIPPGRQVTALHQFDLGRELRIYGPVGGEQFVPPATGLRTLRSNVGSEVVADGIRNQKL